MPDGFDWQQITFAQRLALDLHNGQPTAIVYRTIKGWRYGMEGRASHGAGHGLCSKAFFAAVEPLLPKNETPIPRCDGAQRCSCGTNTTILEECYWQTLSIIRRALETRPTHDGSARGQLRAARNRLEHARAQTAQRRPAGRARLRSGTARPIGHAPTELALKFGTKTTLRDELGRVLNYYNRATNGALCHRRGRFARLDQHQQSGRDISRRILQSADESRIARSSPSAGSAKTR